MVKKTILRALSMILMLALLVPLAVAFQHSLVLLGRAAHRDWFVGSLVLGGVLEWRARGRLVNFRVFEHELTHALVAVLHGRRIVRFLARGHHGGYVEHQSRPGAWALGDHLVGLAPYFLPTLALPSMVGQAWLHGQWRLALQSLAFLAIGWHLLDNLREFRQNFSYRWFRAAHGEMSQTDLGRRGLVFSTLFVICAWLLVHGVAVAGLLGGRDTIVAWGRVFLREVQFARQLASTLVLG